MLLLLLLRPRRIPSTSTITGPATTTITLCRASGRRQTTQTTRRRWPSTILSSILLHSLSIPSILSILSILRRTSWALCIPSIFSISSTSRLSICTSTFNTSPSKCRFRTSNRPARSRSRLIIYCSSTVLCSRLPRPRTTKSSRQLLTCRLLGNSPTLRRPGRRCSQRTLPQQTTSSAHHRQRQLHSSENPGSWRQRLSRDLGTRRSCSIHWPPMLITETQKRSSYRLWCPEISLVQRSGSPLPLQLRPPHQLRQQYQLPQ